MMPQPLKVGDRVVITAKGKLQWKPGVIVSIAPDPKLNAEYDIFMVDVDDSILVKPCFSSEIMHPEDES